MNTYFRSAPAVVPGNGVALKMRMHTTHEYCHRLPNYNNIHISTHQGVLDGL